MPRCAVAVVVLAFAGSTALAQSASGGPGTSTPAGHVLVKTSESLRLTLHRTDQRPAIDGQLDEPLWQDATRLTDFIQFEPLDQARPSQPSIGYVTYDSDNLYIGFRAFEARRADVRSTIYARERGGSADDQVTILIDSYGDQRRAYELRLNPRGIQQDGVRVEGQFADYSVNLVWRSAGRVLADGWSVEAAIPFASLRFSASDTLAFGFNMIRSYGRGTEQNSWAPRRRGSPCDICQQGTLTGITGIDRRRRAEILPYVSYSQLGARGFADTSVMLDGEARAARAPRGFDMRDPRQAVGADLRFSFTPAIVLNAAINPDFSQVESDETQVQANQRFALFLQERRPFFLEGADVFAAGRSTIGDQFYSRAIVDPSVGGRIAVKEGTYAAGVLYARDDAPAYWSNNAHESSRYTQNFGAGAHVLAARARRDVLSNSFVGAFVLGRQGERRATVWPASTFRCAGAR